MRILHTTPQLRRIFRDWSKAAESVSKSIAAENSYRERIAIAGRKLAQLSKASDAVAISEDGATLDQIEFMADICSKLPHPQISPQVEFVRLWLAEVSRSNDSNEQTEQ